MADMPPGMRALYTKAAGAALAQQRQTDAAPQKQAKYRNSEARRGSIRFDSQKEARRYDELMILLQSGVISDLRLQPQFTLQESYITEDGQRIRAIRYTADFSYRFGEKLVVEDVKSGPTRTKEYLRNRKLLRAKYGIDIQEV